ncbi:MAG TPA: DMT family transporter [Candidatus Saccharimonadales bacterium]|jgi:drug/metabolite transporter (DMT)-like permease|nr:DMT family transporter [Candidatus Saccharimonadales bacterium]
MSVTFVATVCGIITAGGYGVGDWLTAKASKKTNKFDVNLAVQFFGTLILLPFLLTTHVRVPSFAQIGITLIISCCITTAYLLLIKALSIGSVGTVVPLSYGYPLPALLLSLIFLGTRFSGAQLVAMFCIIAGAIMLAYQKNQRQIPLRKLHEASLLAIISMLVYGVDFFLVGTLITKLPWQILDVSVSLFLAMTAFILVLVSNRRNRLSAIKRALTNKTTFYAGISFSVGSIVFYVGSHRAGNIIIPTVLSSCAPLVASLLGATFDKEKIGILKRIGAVVVVTGIIILNVA